MFDIESIQALYDGNAVNMIWLVTAYYPTLDIWEADFKTRRSGCE